jgi:hypothetical protein
LISRNFIQNFAAEEGKISQLLILTDQKVMAPYISSEYSLQMQTKDGKTEVDALQNLGKDLNHGHHSGDGHNGLGLTMGRTDEDKLEPIAVVGLALKFPGDATSPEAFWSMMMGKNCASKDYPPDRMNVDAFYHPDLKKPNRVDLPLVTSLA